MFDTVAWDKEERSKSLRREITGRAIHGKIRYLKVPVCFRESSNIYGHGGTHAEEKARKKINK